MSRIEDILVPDIGEFDTVEVIEILVKSGDIISAEDPLLTMESDKASMDVPSPFGGKVKAVKIKAGDRVSQNDLILTMMVIEDSENVAPETVTKADLRQANAPETEDFVSASKPDSASYKPAPSGSTQRPPPSIMPVVQNEFLRAHAGPSVRKFARELGVDLSHVQGSGRKDRITKQDVQDYVKQVLGGTFPVTAAAAAGSGIPAMPEIDFSKFGPIEIQPLSRIQKKSGVNLHRGWLNVPIVTHHDEADITELENYRKSLKEEAARQDIKVTPLAFLLKACVATIQKYPNFNASLTADQENLILKKYLHIGVAVDTPDGLIVPVIRDVDQKGLLELAKELREVSERARTKKLKTSDIQGACFSISSLGGIGGTAFTPLVNAPEVAILGVTRSRMTPVWNGKGFNPRLMLPLDLTYDHRVIDGAQAARFMVYLCGVLAEKWRMSL